MNKSFNSILKTPFQSLSMYLTLTLALLLILGSIISTMLGYSFLQYMEKLPNLFVFFETKIDESQVLAVKKTLVNTGLTSSIKYVSSNEALSIYKRSAPEQPELFDLITAENLPASLEIKPNNPDNIAQIANIAKNQPNVKNVYYKKTTISRLLSFTKASRTVTLLLTFILVISSILIVMTLMAFKIALKKDEIYLLKLLGAKTSYIFAPFASDALLLGTLAAVSAWGIIFFAIVYTTPKIAEFFLGVNSLSTPLLSKIGVITFPANWQFFALNFVLSLIFAYLVTICGTYAAFRRYHQD